jgi:hypothetical protein
MTLSADGSRFWDGVEWRPVISPDGLWRWDGTRWVARSHDISSAAQKKVRRRRTIVVIAILLTIAAVALVVAGFFVWWGIELAGPSQSYIKHFRASQVAVDAAANEHLMDQNLQALRMQRHGFALVTSSYVDGCYADDDDTSQNWQKVCYGRALNFYASRLPALEADGQQLLAVFVQAGWRAGGPRSFSQSCFGYPLDILGGGSNPRITNNYELASVSVVGISVYSPDSITETPQLLSGAASVFRV